MLIQLLPNHRDYPAKKEPFHEQYLKAQILITMGQAVEVKDANGKVSTYRVEIMAPNGLYRNGWRRTTVKPGMAVSFKGVQARNPESINVSGRLFVDGKVMFQGQGPGDDSN